jgi:hypothetical protein
VACNPKVKVEVGICMVGIDGDQPLPHRNSTQPLSLPYALSVAPRL